MQPLILDDLLRLANIRPHTQQLTLGEIDKAGIRPAQPGSRRDDLIEDRLKPHARPAQRPEHVHHPLVPPAEIVKLPCQLVEITIVVPSDCHRETSLRDPRPAAWDSRRAGPRPRVPACAWARRTHGSGSTRTKSFRWRSAPALDPA